MCGFTQTIERARLQGCSVICQVLPFLTNKQHNTGVNHVSNEQLNATDLDFEDLFTQICESVKTNNRGYNRIGGWNENQYEFRDAGNFDDISFNRDVERQLDSILEKLEEDEDILKVSQIYRQIFNMGYDIQRWESLPKDENYKFRIEEVDKDTLKIFVKLSQSPYDWHAKVILRKVDIEGFKLLLNHPELFRLEENIIKKLRKF